MTDSQIPASKASIAFEQASKSLTLTLAGGQKATMTLAEFDALLADLGNLRAKLPQPTDDVDARGAPKAAVGTTVDPKWWIAPNDKSPDGGAVVCLRHAGHGWLGAIIPPHELTRFIGLLQQIQLKGLLDRVQALENAAQKLGG